MALGTDEIITIVASTVLSVVPSIIITYLISANSTRKIINDTMKMINDSTQKMINDTTHKFIALGYAQSKASREERVLSLEDMKEGFDFADKVLKYRKT